MATVEKRRSGRKSGSRRRRRNGGYSDTSRGGSFLDETDREVSSLTDKAFRSLCIGDEAVYNDSELGLSSPCSQRERQLAFDQSVQEREREELKNAAQENFTLRMQQYEQEWIHGGMYGADINRDPQWEAYGERTKGRVSATFMHSFVETSEQEKSLRDNQMSYFSNGVAEVSTQQSRSHSRVSTLIRAFNSEGCRDLTAVEDKIRECNNETSWDKSALMSIEQELSEFSTPYQHPFNSDRFPIAGQLSFQNTNFHSSEVAAMAHMSPNSAASLMRSSHGKLSMSAQISNSNFFIHSEFSPFKVWRDHDRFPFQHGQISGFMPYSVFPKWYETPMYPELSIQNHSQVPYRGIYHSHIAPVPSTPLRSTSTSTMLQKASSVEKRCESELAGHYPNWKRTQILGNNRLPSQRPSTASPTSEMSRRVRDTISSVKALQQKIKRRTGQDVTTGTGGTTNPEVEIYSNNNFIPSANPCGNSIISTAQSLVRSNSSTNLFKSNQLLVPSANASQEAVTSDMHVNDVSPLPVEHPPVRAESRGAMVDVRSSSYKSRAIGLLFNLKDNRKRVKTTYSPAKFKGLDTQEINKEQAMKDTVIDIPEILYQDDQYTQIEDYSRANAHHQHVNMHERSGLSFPMLNSQPLPLHAADYPENISGAFQTVPVPGYPGYTPELMPENCAGSQLTNGQLLHNDFPSFCANKEDQFYNKVTIGYDSHRINLSDISSAVSNLNIQNAQSQRYPFSNTNIQAFNETTGGVFRKVNRYEEFKHNKLDYGDVLSQEQTNTQESGQTNIPAWKQAATVSMQETKKENHFSINKKMENQDNSDFGSLSFDISSQQPQYVNQRNAVENPLFYRKQPSVIPNENGFQNISGQDLIDNSLSQNYNFYGDEKYRHQYVHCPAKDILDQDMALKKCNPTTPKKPDSQSLQLMAAKPPLEQNLPLNILSQSKNLSDFAQTNQRTDRSLVEVMAEHVKAENAQGDLAKSQQWAQVEQPKTDLNGLIIAEPTCSGNVRVEEAQAAAAVKENIKPAARESSQKVRISSEQTEQRYIKAESTRAEQIKAEIFEVQKLTDQTNVIREEVGAVHRRERHNIANSTIQLVEKERVESAVKVKQTDTEGEKQTFIKQFQSEDTRSVNTKAPWDEPVSMEKAKNDSSEEKQVKTEIMNEKPKEKSNKVEQSKIQKVGNKEVLTEEVGKISRDCNAIKGFDQTSIQQNLVKFNFVKLEQCSSQASTKKQTQLEDINSVMGKFKPTKIEKCIFEMGKGENLLEKSAKLTAKVMETQQMKVQRDKVEQVKTELAKAKAELAKIKEKMRGEQRVRLNNMNPINAKIGDSPSVNVNSNKTSKNENHPLQESPQREHAIIKNLSVQPHRGADNYDRLREKYGYINAVSSRSKQGLQPTETVSSNETDETKTLDTIGMLIKEKSKEKGQFATTTTTINETESLRAEEVDSQYIYSESSKEFKLCSSNDLPTKVDGSTTSNIVKELLKSEKCDPMKATEVSIQNYKNINNLPSLEMKTKSPDHNAVLGKDLHFLSLKGLSNKDRAQIKQDILTSKIKAHAEKEISAIKEKGFFLKDGSKGSSKQILGIQSVNIQQRPPLAAAQKNENIMSSNTTLKDHTEASPVQLKPIPSVLSTCSNMSVKTSGARAEELLLRKDYEKPLKNNQNLPEIPSKPKPSNVTVNTTVSHNKNQENQLEKVLPIQKNEQPLQVKQGQQRVENCHFSKNPKENPKETAAQFIACINEKYENSLEVKSGESAKENIQGKYVNHEDSAPSLNLILGQKQSLEADDNLQIMGIMVTVRERKTSEDAVQENSSPQKTESIELENCHQGNSQQVKKDDKQATTVKRPETKEENLSLEMNGNNMTPNDKSDCSSCNSKARTETQPEMQAEKDTFHAENKLLAETQTLSYKQSISSSETKEHQEKKHKGTKRVKTDDVNLGTFQNTFFKEALLPPAMISNISNEHIVHAQTRLEAMKEDLTNDVKQFKIKNKEEKSSSVLDAKSHESQSQKALNPVSQSHSITDIIPNTDENNLENNNAHIDCVANKVEPMTLNNNMFDEKRFEPNPGPSTICEEIENTLVIKNLCEDVAQADSKDKAGNNFKHNTGAESVEPLEIPSLQSQNISTVEKVMAKRMNKSEVSDDVNELAVEGGYFQLQETNISPATVEDSEKIKESPRVPLHKVHTCPKQNKEQIYEAFVFKVDQDKIITLKSSPVSIQDEGADEEKRETKEKLFTKVNGNMDDWSKVHEGVEAGPVNFITKNPTDTESAFAELDQQCSRNSYLTKERKFKEKYDIKTRPKERISIIPEISALADYARLKVIVPEDKEINPVQEFPPNKKEGFFPLIQTRHSRRPVFTVDTLEHSVKDKTQRNKTEMSAKANIEPKAIIYPITEKEHQRTGMFKLGDKERQDRIQSSNAVIDNSAFEQNASACTKTGNKLNDNQTSSSTVNISRNIPENVVSLDKTPSQYLTNKEMPGLKETSPEKKTSPGNNNVDAQPHNNLGGEAGDRADHYKIKHSSLLFQAEETPAKQEGQLQQLDKELTFGKIKEIIEKDLTTNMVKEERSVVQGEEEKRGRGQNYEASPIQNAGSIQIQGVNVSEGGLMENEMHTTKKTQASLTENEEQRQGGLSEEHLEQERVEIKAQHRTLHERQPISATKEELHRKVSHEQPQSRFAYNRGAFLLEQQRKAAKEEQQRKSAQKEQQSIVAQQEQERRARQEEEQKKVVQEEQKRNTARENQQSTATYLRGAVIIEQQRMAAQEAQERKAAEEEQCIAVWGEKHIRATQDEQQRKTVQEQQHRIAAIEWHKRDLHKESQTTAIKEQQPTAGIEDFKKTENRRGALQQEMQKRAVQEEYHRKAAQEKEQQKSKVEKVDKAAHEMQQNNTDEKLLEKAAQEEQRRRAQEKQPKIQEKIKIDSQNETFWSEKHKEEKSITTEKGAVKKCKTEQGKETQAEELMARVIEKNEGVLEVGKNAPERMSIQKCDEINSKKTNEEKQTSAHTERKQTSQIEKQRRLAQMDALQYYAITSPEPEKKSRERQLFSPLQSQRRYNSSRLEQIERSYLPQESTSPAPSLPRSTTSSPALGVKPLMFRVKDNTFRGSTFTKSVKPRFHKNYGEDFCRSQVNNGAEKGDDEQVRARNNGRQTHSDTGLLRHTSLNDISSQGSLPPISYQRPSSRRSIAFDEDDSRSVISTMSEDVESYATSAADLADIRGLYEYERPESACSFSSDVSRSSSKPPTVPPKSDKALRRAQRLTSHRIKKELSKVVENSHVAVQREDSINLPSTITEVRLSNCDAVASPHFSPPLSLAHAPTLESSRPSSHTKQQPNKCSFNASPHATAPILLPNSSAHAIPAISLPAAPKTVAHVPSSPILRPATHAAPVTQYQVESRYPQSYPLTQRKVLQDLGSGQYFVVDVPVEVKTKTFIDPVTGKYVQLNVRESRQSVSQSQPQQLCPKAQLQPQIQVKKHQQTVPHAKPATFHHCYQSQSQSYELAAISSINPNSSVQEQLAVSDSQNHQYPAIQTGLNNNRYSPEKTPYMDTVNVIEKNVNKVQDTHGKFPESDINNQLTCSVIVNDGSVDSQCLSRNIITMSELEDFMEVSDW